MQSYDERLWASFDTSRNPPVGQVKASEIAETKDEGEPLDAFYNKALQEHTQIQHLPNELLCAVFERGATASVGLLKDTRHDRAKVAFEVTISHVSHRWRQVGLSNPFLWTNVRVSRYRPLEQATIYLARSKSCLIDITVDLRDNSHPDPRNTINALAEHVDRWRRFVMKTRSFLDFEPFVVRLRDGYAPHLKCLQLCNSWSSVEHDEEHLLEGDILSAGAPKLLSLGLGGLWLPSCRSLLTGVSLLDLDFPIEPYLESTDLHQFLVACESLERLVLRGSLYLDDPSPASPSCIILPSLLTLEMDIPSAGSICMLLAAPTLQRLDIDGSNLSITEIKDVIDSLQLPSGASRFPELRSLKLMNFEPQDLKCMMNTHFMRSIPTITTFAVVHTRGDGFLRLLTPAAGEVSSNILWPDLRRLVLCLGETHLLSQCIFARSTAGHALLELELSSCSLSRETERWLRTHVKLNYLDLDDSRIADDLSDNFWSSSEDEATVEDHGDDDPGHWDENDEDGDIKDDDNDNGVDVDWVNEDA